MKRVEEKVEFLQELLRKIKALNADGIRRNPARWKDGGEGPLAHTLGHLRGEIAGLREGARLTASDVTHALLEEGFSQAAIARVFGVNQSTISRWMASADESVR